MLSSGYRTFQAMCIQTGYDFKQHDEFPESFDALPAVTETKEQEDHEWIPEVRTDDGLNGEAEQTQTSTEVFKKKGKSPEAELLRLHYKFNCVSF